MKQILTSAAAFCAISFSVFAYSQNGMDDQYKSSSNTPANMTTPHKWQQCMIDKEGWVEMGAEWFYLTSSLSPLYTVESLPSQRTNTGNTDVDIVDRRIARIKPDYNSGFSVFMRYRNCSDNDLLFKYSYLRNNGIGSFVRDDTAQVTAFFNDGNQAVSQDISNNDKGHLHSHLHIFDFLAGRALPINHQMLARLSAGLTVHDFYLFYQTTDYDMESQASANGSTREVENRFYKEKYRFWGLGPKAELALEYLMLPSSWNHSLNMNFTFQYGLLYSKHWAQGKQRSYEFDQDLQDPTNNRTRIEDNRFYYSPDHHLLQNVNCDFGMQYRWESSYANLIFNLAAGYRVHAYWNLYSLFSSAGTFGDDDGAIFFALIRDQTMIYAGPYIRFSLAY